MDDMMPTKERKRIRDKEIKALYRLGYSMEQICSKMNVSKTTVFFAINGRSKKKSVDGNSNNNNNKNKN